MNQLWSIYLKPTELLEVTEVYDMLQRFPHAANHDPDNYIFVATHLDVVNPILASEAVDQEGNQLSGDPLVQWIAKELFATDRSRAIHLSKSEAITLHAHPAWKLWCGNYDDNQQLEEDHEAVFNIGVDRRKTTETLINEARVNLKQLFTA